MLSPGDWSARGWFHGGSGLQTAIVGIIEDRDQEIAPSMRRTMSTLSCRYFFSFVFLFSLVTCPMLRIGHNTSPAVVTGLSPAGPQRSGGGAFAP